MMKSLGDTMKRLFVSIALFAGLVFGLGACQTASTSGSSSSAAPEPQAVAATQTAAAPMSGGEFGWVAQTAEQAAGREVFRRCKSCHSMNPSKNTFGPNLRGIYNRPAASLSRYVYSDALKESGIVWDEDALRSWISGNTYMVGGTRMRHVAIPDEVEQDFLIAFLKSL